MLSLFKLTIVTAKFTRNLMAFIFAHLTIKQIVGRRLCNLNVSIMHKKIDGSSLYSKVTFYNKNQEIICSIVKFWIILWFKIHKWNICIRSAKWSPWFQTFSNLACKIQNSHLDLLSYERKQRHWTYTASDASQISVLSGLSHWTLDVTWSFLSPA